MAGGAATFFTSRFVGRLADRYGSRHVFRLMVAVSLLPILFITHLPSLPFIALLLFFPVFMVTVSGRMVPMQALLTTVAEPATRGAFLSTNSALQALGSGCGAWLGGLLLSSNASGNIEGYGVNGWLATTLVLLAAVWISRVKAASERAATKPVSAETLGEA
jgi:predicted MFS family arabinose efflux permease